jgi:NADH-quinone oxidoreductase subunit A
MISARLYQSAAGPHPLEMPASSGKDNVIPFSRMATMVTWFPILVTLVVAGIVVGVMVNINALIGPKRVSATKMETFECGNPPSGSAWGRFSVRFYLTALLFLVFDVEVIFLYPWAVELRKLGMFGFVEALIFIAILFVGLIYAWERGALDWD